MLQPGAVDKDTCSRARHLHEERRSAAGDEGLVGDIPLPVDHHAVSRASEAAGDLPQEVRGEAVFDHGADGDLFEHRLAVDDRDDDLRTGRTPHDHLEAIEDRRQEPVHAGHDRIGREREQIDQGRRVGRAADDAGHGVDDAFFAAIAHHEPDARREGLPLAPQVDGDVDVADERGGAHQGDSLGTFENGLDVRHEDLGRCVSCRELSRAFPSHEGCAHRVSL